MAAETIAPPATVPDAAREERAAYSRCAVHKRGYEGVRAGGDRTAIARARNEWGLAVFEWAEAVAARAAAEDRRYEARRGDLARGLSKSRRRATRAPGARPGERAHVDACWARYEKIRRDGDVAVTAAREEWRQSLISWVSATVKRSAVQDDQHLEDARRRREYGMRPSGPGDAPGSPPAPEASAGELLP